MERTKPLGGEQNVCARRHFKQQVYPRLVIHTGVEVPIAHNRFFKRRQSHVLCYSARGRWALRETRNNQL